MLVRLFNIAKAKDGRQQQQYYKRYSFHDVHEVGSGQVLIANLDLTKIFAITYNLKAHAIVW